MRIALDFINCSSRAILRRDNLINQDSGSKITMEIQDKEGFVAYETRETLYGICKHISASYSDSIRSSS